MSFDRKIQLLLSILVGCSVALLATWNDKGVNPLTMTAIVIVVTFILSFLLMSAKDFGQANLAHAKFTNRDLAIWIGNAVLVNVLTGVLMMIFTYLYGTGPYPAWTSAAPGLIAGVAICSSFFAAMINGARLNHTTTP